jgi:hypothetical protein
MDSLSPRCTMVQIHVTHSNRGISRSFLGGD